MIYYKIDVMAELKKHGYNQTRIQREQLLPGKTRQNIKEGKPISFETLNKICIMTRMDPGQIIGCEITDEEKIKYF